MRPKRTVSGFFLLWVLPMIAGVAARGAGQPFPDLKGPYLGQKPPGESAEMFAPGIVSTGMIERDIAITPDGKEIYYGLSFGKLATIMVSRLEGGRWTEPSVVSFAADLRFLHFEPCLSADGKTMLFLTNRPRKGEQPEPGWTHQSIWAVEREAGGMWGEPHDLGSPVNEGDFQFFPSLTRDGTLYFTRSKPGTEKTVVMRSRLADGKYQVPEPLPEAVNGKESPYNAFVAPDESYLIACVEGREDSLTPGQPNYYIFFRDLSDRWGEGVNLGDGVNFPGAGANSPHVSPDGRFFFFGSTRAKELGVSPSQRLTSSRLMEHFVGPQNGSSDIYWVRASFIEGLRQGAARQGSQKPAPIPTGEPVTAQEVVARCAEAMGGAEKIAAVKTLRFKIAYADRPLSVITEIKRPNRIRSEAHYVLVFDGKRAGYLKGAPSADGKDPGPRLLPVEEGKDFEVDIAFLFPAFFDYPAEYMGLETVEGKKSHQVGVVLPMGIRMTYFLDAKTLLPTKIVAHIPHEGKVYRPEHAVGDYERSEGILFPRTSTATGWGPKGRAIIESVEVNIPLGDDRFEMPAGLAVRPPEELRQATVPFTLDHNRMVVEAQFARPDGTPRTARAWLDTGSQHLVVAESLARDLGLDLSGLRKDGTQDSADSSSPAPSVRLGGLPLDMKGIKVRVSPGTNLRAGVPAEAMVPASAFRHDHVVFDYPALRMTVARPGTLRPRGTAVPCRVNPETGLFQIAALLDGESVQMGVDNGSAGTWVSEALTAAWRARHPDWPHATGALGSANFFGFPFETQGVLMRLPELRIGTLSARDVAVLGLPQSLFDWYSKKSAGAVDGFIGANVLRGFRLEVDFANGMTYWEAGPPPPPGDLDIVGLTLRPEAGGAFTIAGVATKDGKPAVGGVQAGDKLIRVGSLDAEGALMGTVVDALRGKPGEKRALVVGREGKRLTVQAKVARFP